MDPIRQCGKSVVVFVSGWAFVIVTYILFSQLSKVTG